MDSSAAKVNGVPPEDPFKDRKTEKQGSSKLDCFGSSIALESIVIVLIVISALAVTGENLLRFDLIAVPEHGSYTIKNTSGNASTGSIISSNNINDSRAIAADDGRSLSTTDAELVQVNTEVMDILECVFHYTSLGIAALFCAEIVSKISTMCREMTSQPWQVFDIVVVVVTLGVELTFHYIDLPWNSLYCAKYIVLLRLWRIPFVCNMRARQLRNSMEQDMEVYRNGQQKAEEKCSSLERALSQQAEVLRRLGGTLQTVTSEREPDRGSHQRKSIQNLTSSPLLKRNTPRSSQLRRSLLRRSRNKENETVGVMETELSSRTDASTRREKNLSGSYDVEGAATPGSKRKDVLSHSSDVFSANVEKDNLDSRTSADYVQLREQSPRNSHNPSSLGTRLASPRRKPRRSSTSEYLDYAKLTSSCSEKNLSFEPDAATLPNDGTTTTTTKNRNSEPFLSKTKGENGLPSSHSNSSASDASSPSDIPGRSAQQDTWSSGGLSEDSSLNGDLGQGGEGQKGCRPRGRPKVRRFSSCPEYAFTQRVTMTSDESLLVDDASSENLSLHDNLGYVITDEEGLHVLAEFDGTKTYRSEEGIPMTSL